MKRIIAIIAAIAILGCATNGPDAATNDRNRQVNTALTGAAQVLGQLAVSTLLNTAQGEASGNQDMAHSAAQGVWSQAANWATSTGIKLAIDAFSSRSLPKTAKTSAAVFNASTAPPAAKANAIATVISIAAGAPPKS